jgi:hypothetical protein
MSSRKLLFVASTPTEANLVASFLEGNSIRVELEHLTMASVLPVGGNLSVKVYVFEAQWDRALDLLKTYVEREREDS